jgi:hypothetical protein
VCRSIIGFISKVKAQEKLFEKVNGSFLLRFSDSECGGVTVAWIAEKDPTTFSPGQSESYMLSS